VLLAAVAVANLPSCLKPNPDAVALKAIKEAFAADQMLAGEELTVVVKDRFATISGEVGSALYPQKIDEILSRLKAEGVITGFNNMVTVPDIDNPLFQDFTVPYL